MITKFFIFGDSIAHGIWDKEMGGWVNRLRLFLMGRFIDEDNYYEVYNLGVGGDTSEDILNRLEFEFCQRDWLEAGKVFIFAVGINDSYLFKDKNLHRITPDQFKDNLQYIITLAKKYSDTIIFLGLTVVDEKKTTPTIWDGKQFYENKYIEQYNEIIKEICQINNLLFIDVLPEFSKGDYKKLLDDDGLHPNAKGHQKIFEIVKEVLEKNKII